MKTYTLKELNTKPFPIEIQNINDRFIKLEDLINKLKDNDCSCTDCNDLLYELSSSNGLESKEVRNSCEVSSGNLRKGVQQVADREGSIPSKPDYYVNRNGHLCNRNSQSNPIKEFDRNPSLPVGFDVVKSATILVSEKPKVSHVSNPENYEHPKDVKVSNPPGRDTLKPKRFHTGICPADYD